MNRLLFKLLLFCVREYLKYITVYIEVIKKNTFYVIKHLIYKNSMLCSLRLETYEFISLYISSSNWEQFMCCRFNNMKGKIDKTPFFPVVILYEMTYHHRSLELCQFK